MRVTTASTRLPSLCFEAVDRDQGEDDRRESAWAEPTDERNGRAIEPRPRERQRDRNHPHDGEREDGEGGVSPFEVLERRDDHRGAEEKPHHE